MREDEQQGERALGAHPPPPTRPWHNHVLHHPDVIYPSSREGEAGSMFWKARTFDAPCLSQCPGGGILRSGQSEGGCAALELVHHADGESLTGVCRKDVSQGLERSRREDIHTS